MVFAEGIAQECRKVVQKLNRQGVLRQMNLHEYGLLNHPRAPQSSPNMDLSGKTMPAKNSLSKDEITSAQDIDTTDSNECLTVESQEISYRLYPYSKPSGSQTKMNTSNPKDILVPLIRMRPIVNKEVRLFDEMNFQRGPLQKAYQLIVKLASENILYSVCRERSMLL
ncbi:hypothetical protein Smp_170580 [Schistosoma mansoni]|uniref:hypothetical protein n=1 Tax=Schistosoma mansoni TaxID=6183 RepID=UPI0001A62D62|nr:hypothetical protein Smp_170580 [Schistosoma mansoni]|eukprot:XP_018649365.1 hypothetical protein Smp_170580 [Schistosoma mansoni]